MKKMLFKISILAALACSCSAEDGQDGAIGPQGPQGEQGFPGEDGQDGEDGAQGEQGEQGEAGTANVIYSDWIPDDFPIPPDPAIGETTATFLINASELTEAIKNNGLILLYARRVSGPTTFAVAQLPITVSAPINHYYSFEYNNFNENLSVRILHTEGGAIGYPAYREYRYILIPGGIPTSGKSTMDYTQMSYEEIIAHFNIPE